MDNVALATLVFSAIGALGVVVSNGLALARHRREMNERISIEKQRWSVRCSPIGRPEFQGWHSITLRRSGDEGPGIFLTDLAVKRPRGAKLAPRTTLKTPGLAEFEGGSYPAPEIEKSARRLRYDCEMTLSQIINSRSVRIETLDYSEIYFFAAIPETSSRKRSTRLEIFVQAEEISAERRKIRLIVRSHPIALTTKSADNTR